MEELIECDEGLLGQEDRRAMLVDRLARLRPGLTKLVWWAAERIPASDRLVLEGPLIDDDALIVDQHAIDHVV